MEERFTRRVGAEATLKAHGQGYAAWREVLNAYGNHGAKFCEVGDKYVWSPGSVEERKHQRRVFGALGSSGCHQKNFGSPCSEMDVWKTLRIHFKRCMKCSGAYLAKWSAAVA